jgi:hypothetical protein
LLNETQVDSKGSSWFSSLYASASGVYSGRLTALGSERAISLIIESTKTSCLGESQREDIGLVDTSVLEPGCNSAEWFSLA